MKFYVINGSNLNMIGIRETSIYGERNYDDLCDYIQCVANELNQEVVIMQSNHEGDIIDWMQKAYLDDCDGIILNAGAYACYSYAIYDAIKSIKAKVPVVEVHLSNMHDREAFRSNSVIAKACVGYIGGFGFQVYDLAIRALMNQKETK